MMGMLMVALGVGGCAVMAVALVLVVWAITHDRRPPSA